MLAVPALLGLAATWLVLPWARAGPSRRTAGARPTRARAGLPRTAPRLVPPRIIASVHRLEAWIRPDRTLAGLPLALDLLACALRAGQPPSTAAGVVAAALGGPVRDALRAVARAADLGAPPDIAWQPLGRLNGVAAVTRSVVRAAQSGTRLADELAGIAADLRARRAREADARVRRAGVLVALPLGLCFLPAFVLIGVVPIVIGVSGSVLR